jgi:transketolase
MGYGVDYMMGSHAWHGKAPNDEQLETAFKQLYLEAPALLIINDKPTINDINLNH